MKYSNFMEVCFKALSVNEGFARVCVASFCVQLNPSVDEITDIKTAVSEAVTNCVVHAYPTQNKGDIILQLVYTKYMRGTPCCHCRSVVQDLSSYSILKNSILRPDRLSHGFSHNSRSADDKTRRVRDETI